jgi:nicotinamidase/pyrazinamidase
MPGLLFWDVDTQYDFMFSDGKLYVPGAEDILGPLARLTRHARAKGIRIIASVDHHDPADPEISSSPDYRETYPPHCLAGTPGAAKVDATRPLDPLWIDRAPVAPAALFRHRGELIFRKQRFDVFSNPNTEVVVANLHPDEIFVYGVAQDVCNRYAIDGLLARGYKVSAVRDAMKPIDAKLGDRLLKEWKAKGVRLVESKQLLT